MKTARIKWEAVKNGKNKIEADKKKLLAYLLAAMLVLAAGLAAELLCNLPAIRANAGKSYSSYGISFDQITYEGFYEDNGRLVFEGEEGRIHIPLEGRYVDKFRYSYDYGGLLNLTAYAGIYNEYGEAGENDILTIEDRNSRIIQSSYLKIGKRAEYIDLFVTKRDLFVPGLSYIDFASLELAFTGFEAISSVRLNWYRIWFFWCVFALAAFLYLGRELLGRRVEVGFLAISLSVGTLLSLSLPANKVSWDEEIHFSQALWMAHYRTPISVSSAVTQEFISGIDTWPYNQPDSIEEQQDFDQYLDQAGDYKNGPILWSADLNKTIMTGYAGSALFLKIGSLLSLPFSMLFKLGRLGNLFIYCLVLYFAIKRTPVGKGIMAFLGLMPEPVMLAGVYSYDPTVTAFLYLAFAYLLWAMLSPEETLSWKEYAVILAAFFWGCRIKAIYAPLLLIGLLIPEGHFRNKREMRLMKAGFILLFIILMASFALPVILSPAETGDVRGNNTSEAGQMAYILGQPLSYAWILIKNIWNTLPSYVIGEHSLGLMGHQGTAPFTWLIYVGSVFVILTNGQSSCGKRLNGMQKLWIFALASVAVVFIWTSMYIVFTTPGNTYIDGVQGRYYIPLLFLVWLAFNPSWIVARLKNAVYYPLVLGIGGGMLLGAYYMNVLKMFCL